METPFGTFCTSTVPLSFWWMLLAHSYPCTSQWVALFLVVNRGLVLESCCTALPTRSRCSGSLVLAFWAVLLYWLVHTQSWRAVSLFSQQLWMSDVRSSSSSCSCRMPAFVRMTSSCSGKSLCSALRSTSHLVLVVRHTSFSQFFQHCSALGGLPLCYSSSLLFPPALWMVCRAGRLFPAPVTHLLGLVATLRLPRPPFMTSVNQLTD